MKLTPVQLVIILDALEAKRERLLVIAILSPNKRGEALQAIQDIRKIINIIHQAMNGTIQGTNEV